MIDDIEILNIGCGDKLIGDINIDMFLDTPHILMRENKLVHIYPDIICDAHYLPFRNNAFPLVISNQVIEHVNNPIKMIKEMLRVCKFKCHIETPYKYSRPAKEPLHKWSFNISWFEKVLRNYNPKIELTREWAYVYISLPLNLVVDFWK